MSIIYHNLDHRLLYCLVSVRLLLRPSRSIHFGDVSEANGRETATLRPLDHVTRKALAAWQGALLDILIWAEDCVGVLSNCIMGMF